MLLSMKQDSLRAARETRFWKFHIVFTWTVWSNRDGTFLCSIIIKASFIWICRRTFMFYRCPNQWTCIGCTPVREPCWRSRITLWSTTANQYAGDIRKKKVRTTLIEKLRFAPGHIQDITFLSGPMCLIKPFETGIGLHPAVDVRPFNCCSAQLKSSGWQNRSVGAKLKKK